MADELKPCPFCGGDAELDTQQSYIALGSGRLGQAIAGYCVACTASVSVCREDVPDIDPEHVIEAWNRRTLSPDLAAAHAEIKRLSDEYAVQDGAKKYCAKTISAW